MIDPGITGIIGALMGGGLWHGISNYRRTPAEVESISVASLLSTLKYRDREIADLRDRVTAQDQKLVEQDTLIASLRERVAALEHN